MSLITLKPLDDGQKPVEIPKGKTVIGRGSLLGCSDKKVSRNHAVIEVTNKDEVFLTPTHVNPCFYQPTADSPGQILKKDVPCKLENGDSFSLLPRAYRYQLNIDNGPPSQNDNNGKEQCSGKTNGSTIDHIHDGTTTNEEFGDTIVPEKAFFKEEASGIEKNCTKDENTFSKRIAEIKGTDEPSSKKTSDGNTEKETPTPQKEATPPSTTATAAAAEEPLAEEAEEEGKAEETSNMEQNNLSGDDEKVTKDEMDNVVPEGEKKGEVEAPLESRPPVNEPSDNSVDEAASESLLPPTTEAVNEISPVPSTTKKQKENLTRRREKQVIAKRKTALESAPTTKGRKKAAKTKFQDDGEEGTSRQPGRTSSRTNRQTRQGLSLEDFIVSDDDEWQSDQSEPKQRRRKRGKQRGDDSGSDWEVEHKKPKKVSLHKGWSGSESGSERNDHKKKKGARGRRKKEKSSDEVNETLSEEDEPQPSSSGEVKLNKTRTPCTFGKKCYRRNASHKEQFIHPGDSDYTSESESKKNIDTISESDGESSPPKKECPYGANCFRKNPQHKKDFKHTKNVRPQREAAKQADQKSKNCRNSDDYDLNDSFLNDDSDEYKPVDSGSDYESGEQKTKKLTKVKGGGSRKGAGKKL